VTSNCCVVALNLQDSMILQIAFGPIYRCYRLLKSSPQRRLSDMQSRQPF